jgi:hypothetical protein
MLCMALAGVHQDTIQDDDPRSPGNLASRNTWVGAATMVTRDFREWQVKFDSVLALEVMGALLSPALPMIAWVPGAACPPLGFRAAADKLPVVPVHYLSRAR